MIVTLRNSSNATDFYNYPFSQKFITYLLMPSVSLFSIVLGAFLLATGRAIVGALLLILFGACLLFLSAFGSLMCSSISISDEGIAARNFGRTLKFIRWEKVTKIKKVRRWNAGSRSYENVFHIFDGNVRALPERMVNLRGPIVFSDKIRRVQALLSKINKQSQLHHVPLVTHDQELGLNETRVTEF